MYYLYKVVSYDHTFYGAKTVEADDGTGQKYNPIEGLHIGIYLYI